MVRCIQPQAGETIQDPLAGTPASQTSGKSANGASLLAYRSIDCGAGAGAGTGYGKQQLKQLSK